MVEAFLEEAEQVGFAGDTCAYHRAVLGAARKGFMPEPDFLIAATCPCSGGVAVMELLARHFDKDLGVKNQILAANKTDIPEAARNLEKVRALAEEEGLPLYPISAVTREGVRELVGAMKRGLDQIEKEKDRTSDTTDFPE